MNGSSSPAGRLTLCVVCVVALAAVAPSLIGLVDALLPLAIVLAVAVVVIRLVFFHTRRW